MKNLIMQLLGMLWILKTFHDIQKFELQNPLLGKIATQVKASKLTDEYLTNKILMQDDIAKIENRLEELKRPINFNDSNDETRGPAGGGGMMERLQLFHQRRVGEVLSLTLMGH